ncbi:Predicted arabinose efflux permease, MFS family [Modestobacter sp. DSM 44400]|uniref:MFS transporter n=1 Tax=Modestobacter sp. DSM 44400 TaxID=1550230 RepID=UPI00089A445C|nr:MFS transporter [Modestobacter sp. DSM 44400]SDY15951.1 Predicted arabinose efflux permease, MFS family [Modestobacter sp. DSM 44400]
MPSLRLSRPAGFWSVALLLVLVLAASGVPSPLYRVYQERFGFSSGVLTLIFGVYAFALLLALLIVGELSDHIGRRPVLAGALLMQAAAMVLFLVADGVGWLIAARIVQGLGTGALTGAMGAALLDLQRPEKPLGPLVNSASPGFGLSLGAVAAGLLVEYVADPTDWVFSVLAAAFVLAAVAIMVFLPESSPQRPGALRSLLSRVHVPRSQRPAFITVLPCLLATWALGGLYASLGPSLVATVFGIDDHLVGSLLILALNGTGLVGSLGMRSVAPARAMVTGALVFVVGIAGTIVALATVSTWLFFAAAVVSGFGFGAAFLGAIATVTQGVAPGERAGLLSAVFTASYLAFSVPAIAAGVAATSVGLALTAEVYGGAVIVLALTAVAGLVVRRQPVTVEPAAAPVRSREPVA